MTPMYCEVLMAIYSRGRNRKPQNMFPKSDALADCLISMVNDDLIEEDDVSPIEDNGRWFTDQIQNTRFRLTEKGYKFLRMILETPQPVQDLSWKDPRRIR